MKMLLFFLLLTSQAFAMGKHRSADLNYTMMSQLVPIETDVQTLPNLQSNVLICENIGEIYSTVATVLKEIPSNSESDVLKYMAFSNDLEMAGDSAADMRISCMNETPELPRVQADLKITQPQMESLMEKVKADLQALKN